MTNFGEAVKNLYGQFGELKALVSEVASLSGILDSAESASKSSSSQASAIGTLEDVQVTMRFASFSFATLDLIPLASSLPPPKNRMPKLNCHELAGLFPAPSPSFFVIIEFLFEFLLFVC